MIKFFRSIRHYLLNEGRVSKYLLYAIGEIVLVVIGILIALYINNKNEANKSELAQRQLLTKLISDLESDIVSFENIDSIYNQDLEHIKYVIDQSLSFKNKTLNSPEQMVAGRGSVLYFALNNSSYEEMINTGLLYQLKDEDLKDEITKYYKDANFLLEKENRDNQNVNNYLLGIKDVDPKKLIMRLREKRNLESIDWSWLQDPNSGMYREIETNMIWTKAAIKANQDVMNQITKNANSLKKSIQAYLKKG